MIVTRPPKTRNRLSFPPPSFKGGSLSSNKSSRQALQVPQTSEYLPLVEENPAGFKLPIFVKWRPLARSVNHRGLSGAVKGLGAPIISMSHWAIEVGNYTHELRQGADHTICRSRGRWVDTPWDGPRKNSKPTKIGGRIPCGETQMTDFEIDSQGGFAERSSYLQ